MRTYLRDNFLKNALIIGMTEEQFWKSNPAKYKVYIDAYKEKRRIADSDMWLMGAYVHRAVSVSIANCFSKGSNAKYFEEPLMSKSYEDDIDSTDSYSEDDIKNARNSLLLNLEAMQANFNSSHSVNTEEGDADA